MIGRLHFSTSLVLSYLIYNLLGVDEPSSIVLSIVTASLSSLPDLDYRIHSWADKKRLFLEKTKLKYFLFPIYLFLILLIKIFRHRGITHSIFPIILFLFLSLYFKPFFILFLAFTLHIMGDIFTVSGIQPFYPIGNIRVRIPILSNRQRFLQTVLSYIFIFIYILLIL